MKKERLTKESCRKDLMLGLKAERRYLTACAGILLILLVILIAPLAALSASIPSSAWLFPWMLGLFCLFPADVVFILCRWHLGKKWIQTVELSVTEAKLNNIAEYEIRAHADGQYGRLQEARRPPMSKRTRYYHIDRYVFYFSSYGRYVPPMRNFDWCEYAMSDEGLSNCSLIGDTFYLFTYTAKKKTEKIAFAYPAKYFEWAGDNVQE